MRKATLRRWSEAIGGRSARLVLALVLLVAPVSGSSSVAAQPVAQLSPIAPANLRCQGPKLAPEPAPLPDDWIARGGVPALPKWEWRDVISFNTQNGPGTDSPLAVAIGADCTLYVADVQRSEVVQLAPDGTPTGVTYRLPGDSAPGETNRLQGVAVDLQGNVYATDSTRALVHKFAGDGHRIATWGQCTPTRNCDPSTGPGLFIGPAAIAVDGLGNVYVSEATGHRIQKLRSDGVPLKIWRLEEAGLGQFMLLGGMAIDANGLVYVADGWNNVVYKFTPNGELVTKIGAEGTDLGKFKLANGVAVDTAGNVYVSDRDNWRVQKLDANGQFQQVWRNCLNGTVEACAIAGAGDGPGQFYDQRGLVVDGQGSLYVADYGNDRVQRLAIVGYTDPIAPPDLDPAPPTEPDPDLVPPSAEEE